MTTTRLLALAAAAALLVPFPARAQQSGAAAARPDVPIRDWLVAGVFPTDSGATRVTRAYLPDEARLAPAAGEPAGSPGAWRAVRADTLGRLDFNQLFPDKPMANAGAYALTYLWSPAERTVSLAVESDDDVLVWLNGALVERNEVARGVGNGVDTLVLRLARGYNRILYKVLNRTGGFGLGGRLLGASADPVADLRTTTTRPATAELQARPAPTVTLGPVRVGDDAVVSASPAGTPLLVPIEVGVARWGGLTDPITLVVGTRRVNVPAAPEGETRVVAVPIAWAELAAAAAQGPGRIEARAGQTVLASVPLMAAVEGVLSLLAQPIGITGWQAARSDPAAAGTPGGAPWFPLDQLPDSAGRAAIGSLAMIGRVPAALAGLSVDLDVAELLPEARITVNGSVATADAMGRVPVCAPCTADAPLQVVIGPNGARWWDLPRLRVREPGWLELREGARWARFFTGDSTIASPDSSVARALLAAALKPDKRDYLALTQEWLGRLAPAAARIRRDTVALTGNSHIDAAWLWRWPETVDVVRNTWRSATKLMRKYPEMRYAASSAAYYVWLEKYEPTLLAAIQQLVKQGRWEVVSGWWVEPDANMPSGESLARQGLYGQRTIQRLFGKTSTVGWIPDTFGYPWTLPQILKKSGMTSFVTQKLHWNDRDPWPASLEQFWWESPDGSRVLAYIPFGYDSDLSPEPLARQWKATRDSAPIPAMLTLFGVGDHGGGPTAEMLDRRRTLERIPTYAPLREQTPGPALQEMTGRLSRLATSPAPYPGGGREPGRGTAPVVRDELYLEFHRGVFTTQAGIKTANRRMEGLLGAAEAAAVTASSTNAFAYPATDLTAAWEKTLFNQFHDLLAGSGIREIYEDAAASYDTATALAGGVLKRAVGSIAERLDTHLPAAGMQPFVVFNPSARPRTAAVRVFAPAGLDAALDGTGRRLQAARAGDSLDVQVEGVPALGAMVVYAGTPRAVARATRTRAPRGGRLREAESFSLRPAVPGARVLENTWLRAEVDPRTGNLARLFDKRLRREMVGTGANALVMIEDRPREYDAWNIDDLNGARTPVDQDVRVGQVARGALGMSVVVERSAPGAKVRQVLTVPARAARLDVETTIDWSASHQLLKAVFPLAFRADSSWAEIPYGVIARPTRPVTRRDSARFEVPMLRWVEATAAPGQDTTGTGTVWGVAIANDSKYGYDAHGDTLRITLLRSAKAPDPRADMGTHHFHYALVPHPGDYRAQAIEAAAVDLNEPLRVFPVDAHPGASGSIDGPVSVAGAGVRLGAVKRAEDDGATVIRLVETHGRPTTAAVRVAGASSLIETNLLERPTGASISGQGGLFRVPLKPWEIRTFVAR